MLASPKSGMGKIGFKPKWTESHTKSAEAFAEQHTGKEPAVSWPVYVKWLYSGK